MVYVVKLTLRWEMKTAMNKRKMDILFGLLGFILVYFTCVLIFLIFSFSGFLFVEEDSRKMGLYSILLAINLLLYTIFIIKVSDKKIIMMSGFISLIFVFATPSIVPAIISFPGDVQRMLRTNHKEEIQTISKMIDDHNLPFSIFEKESLSLSKDNGYISIMVLKYTDEQLTKEDIQNLVKYLPFGDMKINFNDNINGEIFEMYIDKQRNVSSCLPIETCNEMELNNNI